MWGTSENNVGDKVSCIVVALWIPHWVVPESNLLQHIPPERGHRASHAAKRSKSRGRRAGACMGAGPTLAGPARAEGAAANCDRAAGGVGGACACGLPRLPATVISTLARPIPNRHLAADRRRAARAAHARVPGDIGDVAVWPVYSCASSVPPPLRGTGMLVKGLVGSARVS